MPNVAAALARRELGNPPRGGSEGGGAGTGHARSTGRSAAGAAALEGWGAEELLLRSVGVYCDLASDPRSTIAAAFSPDGRLLASTQCAPSSAPKAPAPAPAPALHALAAAARPAQADVACV